MKGSKKTILIVLCVIALAAAVGILCIGLQVAPTVNHALRIAELLQPVMDAKNQTMHIAVSAELGSKAFDLDSDIFRTTEDGVSYLAVEQNRAAVYIADNVLFMANGKAFKIGDMMQPQTKVYDDLLPQIGALYGVLKISTEKTDNEATYSITVTGEQADTLLEAASLGEALPVEWIDALNLRLTEKNGKLDHITFSGRGNANGTVVQLHVTVSGFRVLATGDYPIPEVVKQSAATVNPDALFSLTEDLYRLVLALTPFVDMDTINGTLVLTVDCGPLQLDTRMDLSDLKTPSNSQIDPKKLQALPETLGWLCMEGDISCIQSGDGYAYVLELDQAAMKELSGMILPEMTHYSGDFTGGSSSIILEGNRITSMQVSIKGEINAVITRIPISVVAEFFFS